MERISINGEKWLAEVLQNCKISKAAQKDVEEIHEGNDYEKLSKIVKKAFVYHKALKIEGLTSFDSSSSCDFCEKASKIEGSVCAKCYARRGAMVYPNVKIRHSITTALLMDYDLSVEDWCSVVKLAKTNIQKGYALRYNADGELANQRHADNVVKSMHAINAIFPGLKMSIWTKRPYLLAVSFAKFGKPKNLEIEQSSIIIGEPCKKHHVADHTFTVYRKKEIGNALSIANECNGAKCKDCGYKCYLGLHEKKKIDIAELLRNK